MGAWRILPLLLTAHTVMADTVVLLGGEVDSMLHPAIATVETVGPCGTFVSDLPDLVKPRREGAAAHFGSDLVVCGGYAFLGAIKTCTALTLGTGPLQWRDFPHLIHAREKFGLVVVGGDLFAVGGSVTIGSQHSIERFNVSLNAWEEFGEIYGFRQDYCTLPWGEEEILLVGGYDDIGNQRRTSVYNTTSRSWRELAPLIVGRGMHACALYAGGVIVAGGWTDNKDPDWPGQVVTRTSEWYDPAENTWVAMGTLRNSRTMFALEVLNGTLTALGGWEGIYTESVETMAEDGTWEWADHGLSQQKAAFGSVWLVDEVQDEAC